MGARQSIIVDFLIFLKINEAYCRPDLECKTCARTTYHAILTKRGKSQGAFHVIVIKCLGSRCCHTGGENRSGGLEKTKASVLS